MVHTETMDHALPEMVWLCTSPLADQVDQGVNLILPIRESWEDQ